MTRTAGVVRPRLTMNTDVFGKDLDRRLKALVRDVEGAILPAAATATQQSRAIFDAKRSPRPGVAPRPGRPTTEGQFASFITWLPHRNRDGELIVDLDLARLDEAHEGRGVWLIQEIGTGKAAYVGRPDGSYERRVKVASQVGRAIPFGLVWANGGGQYRPPGAATDEQLAPYVRTTGRPPGALTAGVIRREIAGKHYLRDGGIAGYQQFASSAIGAARRAFAR